MLQHAALVSQHPDFALGFGEAGRLFSLPLSLARICNFRRSSALKWVESILPTSNLGVMIKEEANPPYITDAMVVWLMWALCCPCRPIHTQHTHVHSHANMDLCGYTAANSSHDHKQL